MANTTLISWAYDTFNGWVGCDKIAPECVHCYINREIRKQSDWQSGVKGQKREPWGKLYLTKTTWQSPYQHQMELRGTNKYRRIFTCSLSDFFHAGVDDKLLPWNTPRKITDIARRAGYDTKEKHMYKAPWRDVAWQVIRETPNCVYLILTKRPENILSRLPKDWGEGYPNVWLGTSAGCNSTLSKVDSLRKVPVHPQAVRFLSCEPLLEDISQNINLEGIGWVIAGGESGTNPEYRYAADGSWKQDIKLADKHGRRTMELMWAYNLMFRAKQDNRPFWFKQVTASKSSKGVDALGMLYHEAPDAPNGGLWDEKPESKLINQEEDESNA